MLDAGHFVDGGGNLDAEVGAAEPDPRIRASRLERQRHLLTGVKPDSGARNLTFESPLSVHPVTVSVQVFSKADARIRGCQENRPNPTSSILYEERYRAALRRAVFFK